MKRFLEWIGLKEKLHLSQHKPPTGFRTRCLVGKHGRECWVRDEWQEQPLFATRTDFKKNWHMDFIWLRLQLHKRTRAVHLKEQDEFVCLNQIRVIDYRRLHSKLGQIDTDNFDKVREGFRKLYG
jgi:hypothetical protein